LPLYGLTVSFFQEHSETGREAGRTALVGATKNRSSKAKGLLDDCPEKSS
jgi:hypothetical protein